MLTVTPSLLSDGGCETKYCTHFRKVKQQVPRGEQVSFIRGDVPAGAVSPWLPGAELSPMLWSGGSSPAACSGHPECEEVNIPTTTTTFPDPRGLVGAHGEPWREIMDKGNLPFLKSPSGI